MDSQLKSRQIILLAAGMLIFTMGFGIIVPVMPYYASSLGAVAFDLGLLMATFSVMQFIFAPFWGQVSDRIGRKPVMMIGLLGFGISFTVTGLSSQPQMLAVSEAIGHLTGLTPHIGVLFCSELIGGTLSAGIWPAVLAYIADITEPGERGGLMGTMGAASGLGIIFGPAISGFIAAWGLTVPFFAAAGLALVTAVLSAVLLPESHARRAPELTRRLPMADALKTSLGIIFLLTLFISFSGAFIDSTFAYFMMDRFGLSDAPSSMPVLTGSLTLTGPGTMGIVFATLGVIGVLCQGLFVGRVMKAIGEVKTIICGLAFVAAGLLLLLISVDLLSLILFISLIGIGSGLVNPSLNTLVSKRTDPDNQGSMLGVLGSFNSFGRAIGPPVGGMLYMVNMALPYAASAGISAVAAAILYVKARGEAAGTVDARPAIKA